jgi:hypothetical protein
MRLGDLKNLDKDRVLAMIGLQTLTSATATVLRSVGLVVVGAAIGAGAALLLAPKSGKELRKEIRRHFKNGVDEMMNVLPDKMDEVPTPGT